MTPTRAPWLNCARIHASGGSACSAAIQTSSNEDEEGYRAEANDLQRFLVNKVMAWFETRRKELENRPLIREQAFGEALDPAKLEQLGRYEVHLDRKLERTLSMLIRLQQMRRGDAA